MERIPLQNIQNFIPQNFRFPCREQKQGKIRLVKSPRSEVWIDKGDETLLCQWFDRPREMVRRLLKLLIGDENLIQMSARGRRTRNNPGRPGIPDDIINAITGNF